jgi:hypothetical protein
LPTGFRYLLLDLPHKDHHQRWLTSHQLQECLRGQGEHRHSASRVNNQASVICMIVPLAGRHSPNCTRQVLRILVSRFPAIGKILGLRWPRTDACHIAYRQSFATGHCSLLLNLPFWDYIIAAPWFGGANSPYSLLLGFCWLIAASPRMLGTSSASLACSRTR